MSLASCAVEEHAAILQRIQDADIILATDKSAMIEFTIFGKVAWESADGDFSHRTLTIYRIDVNGADDVRLACNLVEQVKGYHEFASFLDGQLA
jgi:hypothetical protein